MILTMLKSKLHRANVTDADLDYEGSISIGPELMDAAKLIPYEKVDIYNVNNGARFSTYVIPGEKGDICLNGAAARHVHRGDKVIIASYVQLTDEEALNWNPRVVLIKDSNEDYRIES